MRITQRNAQPYKSATNEKDANNLSPFYMCVENQYSEKYNMLAYGTEFLPNKNNLFALLDKKDFHAAHLLFSISAKNKKILQDAFWLEKYILERDVDAVRFLLRHGANTKNIILTEKMCDMILGSFAITKLLLDYGLAATAKSTKGYPLIFYAAEIKNKEVVKLLVKHGAISYFDFKLILYTNFYKVAKEIFPHCRQHINFFSNTMVQKFLLKTFYKKTDGNFISQ